MGKLHNRIADQRVLRIIRRYLEAGIIANGVATERHEGTPQGGPISPLLANVLPDDVDKELERRGHTFVRYADDCNVYVRSKRAGERVRAALRQQYAKLRLRINDEKSAVERVWGARALMILYFTTGSRAVADEPYVLTPYHGTGFRMQCYEAFFGMSRPALGLAEGDIKI